jgi:hypothetical protein
MTDKKLLLIGRVLRQARLIVGGTDLNGFYVISSPLEMLSDRCAELKYLLDAYDKECIDEIVGALT